ncbi:MAG: hypothetical protein NTY19_10735 [Planctomycetota bacterium]|nr:hypothetical protein [Planctomycetota bacterium]
MNRWRPSVTRPKVLAWLCLATLALAFGSCQAPLQLATRPVGQLPAGTEARLTNRPVGPPAYAGPSSPPAAYPVMQAAYGPTALPPNATTGAPYFGPAGAPGAWCGPPEAQQFAADPYSAMYDPTWRPPGISGPWPPDEYIFDGGDRAMAADVRQDWTVMGLDTEDTIAHYETLEGRTEVRASNRVAIYAPRFASVRKVYGFVMCQQEDRAAGVEVPTKVSTREERRLANTFDQPLQPGRYVGNKGPQRFREAVHSSGVGGLGMLAGVDNRFKVYENFEIIRSGKFDNTEKARLAERLSAAIVWSSTQAVQAVIDNMAASVAVNHVGLQSVYHYETPPGKPRLRIVKVASQRQAQPGEIIEFTLRFDNHGDQLIGNVTIVDSLTTRLEYVPDSAQCSVPAKFMTQENDGESLVLRWEIAEPLQVGDGGLIRFKCRVR